MTAQIFSLAPSAAPTISTGTRPQAAVGRHVWHGASGRRYVHAVYSLIECPPLPKTGYLLVRRDAAGTRTVLHIDQARDAAPTLNLARVRQRGALLGANEVHISEPVSTSAAADLAIYDLRAGLFGELAIEPSHAA